MTKAIWNDTVLAETDAPLVVEGNYYFPPAAIHAEYFQASEAHTECSWKGTASYYDVVVNGQVNSQAAWYYPEPKAEAAKIKGYVAFWKGVRVEP